MKEQRGRSGFRTGRSLLLGSIMSRGLVILLLCALALLTHYSNHKLAYNHARLVELSNGPLAKFFYELADTCFSCFENPLRAAQSNAGMTWSIQIMGVHFTDPIAALSLLFTRHALETGFALGALIPMGLALCFGRVFCAYICPASLIFFCIARVRRTLLRWFLFPSWSLSKGFAWGILSGGLLLAAWFGHGVWTLILPYFALGQTIFHGLAMGSLSITIGSLLFFALLDLFAGNQFTCRHLCPTGRLLGTLGTFSAFTIQRKASECIAACNICHEICPMQVNPKQDETKDCSMCGECMIACPTHCLSVRPRHHASIPVAPIN